MVSPSSFYAPDSPLPVTCIRSFRIKDFQEFLCFNVTGTQNEAKELRTDDKGYKLEVVDVRVL